MSCYISVFDMLKIGVGPSSSHTLGPWRAAERFILILKKNHLFEKINKIVIRLYGSLSLTGKGHATDLACMLGLSGFKPETIPVEQINFIIGQIKKNKVLNLDGQNSINFNPDVHIEFSKDFLSFHSNALRFTAILQDGSAFSEVYYSIGGGFIVKEDEVTIRNEILLENIPFEISKGEHISLYAKTHKNLKISDFARQNELTLGRSEEIINEDLMKIWKVMEGSIFLGAITSGVLPGGLNVKRRAFELSLNLLGRKASSELEFFQLIKAKNWGFTEVLDFVNIFALAVNEVNASLGRVVTAPTNGSAGVIPSVLAYYLCFVNKNAGAKEITQFLLNAGLIGGLFKNGATISAAAGGCQAEIGVSSAMAASALTEMQGGNTEQCMVAAEIAMEHHLGMTCDPIGGLVQIPCIERNTMGAVKAINASNLALKTEPNHAIISLDSVIKTMLETAEDMNIKYKETSMGGLAKVSVKNPDC